MRLSQSFGVHAAGRLGLLAAMLAFSEMDFHACAAAEVYNIKVVTDGNPDYTDAAEPGKLIQETPTLKCLGVRWLIGGDGNANARIAVTYRK